MIRIAQIFVMSLALGVLQLSAEIPKRGNADVGQSRGNDDARERCDSGTLRMGVVRDPALHRNWRVVRIANHPEWPAALQPIPEEVSNCSRLNQADGMPRRRASAVSLDSALVHSGDVLVISDETAVLRGDFDAVALSNGGLGDSIRVRLRFADKVTRGRVTAYGRAVLDRVSGEVYR